MRRLVEETARRGRGEGGINGGPSFVDKWLVVLRLVTNLNKPIIVYAKLS